MHLVGLADLDVARARSQLASAGWAAAAISPPRSLDDALKTAHDLRHRRRRCADRLTRDRGDRRGDRRSGDRHPLRAGGDRRTASISSWSMSKPTRWPVRCWRARRAAAGVVYSLAWGDQPALICEHVDWARACGFKVVSRRQGHALSPDLSPVHARHGVGHPRQIPADQRPQLDQSEDVQLVHRRHQVRHRDDGGLQRHRPRAADERPWLSAGDAASSLPISASRKPKAARWRRPA